VVDAWPLLSEAKRAGIVAMVKAASGGGKSRKPRGKWRTLLEIQARPLVL